MSLRTFETTGNDNYLDMREEWHRELYEGMKSQNLHCRQERCYCAYGHYGWCSKCGHYAPKVMLNP